MATRTHPREWAGGHLDDPDGILATVLDILERANRG